MYIKCWGTRGSIPVSGSDFLTYGGDTTCFEIRSEQGDLVIVDAGTGIRNLGNKLLREKTTAFHLLFTHMHWDHIMGLTAFAPIFNGAMTITVPRLPFEGNAVESALSTLFSAPTFPVPFNDVKPRFHFTDVHAPSFSIGSLSFETIPIRHPNGGLGYKISDGPYSMVILSDNELGMDHPGGASFEEYTRFVTGCDLLLHDAEYTPKEYRTRKGWGHSCWKDAVRLAWDAGVPKLGFIHHHAEHSDADIDVIIEEARLESKKIGSSLEIFAMGPHWICPTSPQGY